jgi:hypothetical protein
MGIKELNRKFCKLSYNGHTLCKFHAMVINNMTCNLGD